MPPSISLVCSFDADLSSFISFSDNLFSGSALLNRRRKVIFDQALLFSFLGEAFASFFFDSFPNRTQAARQRRDPATFGLEETDATVIRVPSATTRVAISFFDIFFLGQRPIESRRGGRLASSLGFTVVVFNSAIFLFDNIHLASFAGDASVTATSSFFREQTDFDRSPAFSFFCDTIFKRQGCNFDLQVPFLRLSESAAVDAEGKCGAPLVVTSLSANGSV
ncbi:unnamed protein product [Linum trigynum]|uniref:Uncharacterized protein n=1 Tax=Linum trigynum TaxID=586398 RepID=A0AAV2DCV0_9ROSI